MPTERHGGVVVQKAALVPGGVPLATGSPWQTIPGTAPLSLPERAAQRAKEIAMKKDKPIKMRALTRQEAPDGRRLDIDAEFEVYSEQDALLLAEKGLATRLSPESKAEPAEESETDTSTAAEDEPWTMILEPEMYLQKYGDDAKHSSQAKAEIVRRKAAAVEKG